MVSSLESLEEKFRQVEQASERRILDRSERRQSELVDSSTRPSFYYKRPLVSVNQFGKLEKREEGYPVSRASSPLSAPASRSGFYHSLASPRSFDSFLSTFYDQQARHTDEHHEIQVERIVGRQTLPKTVGALLPRRRTGGMPQLDYDSANAGMVIDVSVETRTESSHSPLELQGSTVYATRPRSSTVGTATSQSSLVERAKGLARKLRRKSKAELL